jgi:hypothetical protein
MRPYLPPKIPDPKKDAERRARIISTLIWLAAVPPLLFALMAYGYSDQAPAFLRELTIALDGLVGSPVWSILNPGSGR